MGSVRGPDEGRAEGARQGQRSQADGLAARPWRRAAALGIGAEALALAVYAVAYGIHATGLPEPAFAVGLALFFGFVALGLGAVARAFDHGARWSVSAALTWQALLTLAGINLTGVEHDSVHSWYGWALAAAGVGVGIAAFIGGRDALRAPEAS
ncbi:hypothetical protein [Demequina mangrovi]|uniref:hypothetical protein n=1 Tax=Demequina mangrovi TaxID=1043493 RepID=UPI000AA9E1EC|nr:hypothetical protein [Demequina mangrovi]